MRLIPQGLYALRLTILPSYAAGILPQGKLIGYMSVRLRPMAPLTTSEDLSTITKTCKSKPRLSREFPCGGINPNKLMNIDFKELDNSLMVMAAHRYSMGRHSYIVHTAISYLKKVWDELDPGTQDIILRDTVEYLMEYKPTESYYNDWHIFAQEKFVTIGADRQLFIDRQTSWRDKPFPLKLK